jgi:hypothetical protein
MEPPATTKLFGTEFTNLIWARLDKIAIPEDFGEQHSISIAAELPHSIGLPDGTLSHRCATSIDGEPIAIDIYNDCHRIYTSDHFTPERTERYKLLRSAELSAAAQPFPENARRKFISPMRSVVMATFNVRFQSQELFILHMLSAYCTKLMRACNAILEAERCTYYRMSWNFPYHLSFLSVGLYWVSIENPNGSYEARAFMGNSGHIALNPPVVTADAFERVMTAIKPGCEYPIWWQYYCKAATLLGQQSYRSAVLESIIALEMALSVFVRRRLTDRGVSKSSFERVKKDITLSLMLNIELTSLAPDDQRPAPEIVGRLNRARKLRNLIVHEGKASVSESEATEAVEAVRLGLKYLSTHITESTETQPRIE